MEVSIPQSEFCPLGLIIGPLKEDGKFVVSIPQSEFCPLGRRKICQCRTSFFLFQFLSRNSVRWDLIVALILAGAFFVSIPQSEFCPLGL